MGFRKFALGSHFAPAYRCMMRPEQSIPKPKRRSALRVRLGLSYHRAKRSLANALDRQAYADTRELQDLPHPIFSHQTPLFRPLIGVARPLMDAKVTNLRRAVEAIDGLVLAPGEALSFWRRVGAPLATRGFVKGFALHEGKVVPSIGGGLCQASNLLFWMAAHSPLQLMERWRHSYDVFADVRRTQPFGSGATVAFNHRDLRLLNPTAHRYQIRLWLSPTHLHGALNADAPLPEPITVEESDHAITSQWWGGYARHNKLWRVQGARRSLLVENNALLLYEPLLSADTT